MKEVEGTMKWTRTIGALALAASLTAARPAQAAYLEDAGWGALTVLTNAVYMPAKLVYATLGAVTGGFAYALTDGDLTTAETVWVTTMGGTYVVTPPMLQGEDPIAFSGTPGESPANADASSTPGLEERDLNGS